MKEKLPSEHWTYFFFALSQLKDLLVIFQEVAKECMCGKIARGKEATLPATAYILLPHFTELFCFSTVTSAALLSFSLHFL